MSNQRLADLVRHQRHELFNAELITESEYAELMQDHAAVARLEDYDRLQQWGCNHCSNARAALAALAGAKVQG